MKQIDARPEDYRTQDVRGRWVENIDRRFCRWASLIGLGVCAMFVWKLLSDGDASPALPAILVGYLMGLSSGGLFILSLFPTAR